jgi:CheY-like chemotaxis protein
MAGRFSVHDLITGAVVNILFLDDHRNSADAFAEIALSLGHEVKVAYDGKTAIQFTSVEPFDVVFLDIELPDSDGRDLCRIIRRDGASRDACIIAITGLTDLRGPELDPFDGYLHKPFSAAALEHALKFSEG